MPLLPSKTAISIRPEVTISDNYLWEPHRYVNNFTMERIEKEQFQALIRGAEVISRDTFGEKVLRLRDGRILKLFRLKRVLSSSLFSPYAVRFKRNAEKLQERKIPSVSVTAVYRIKTMKRDAVIYRPLEGETLRDVLATTGYDSDLLSRFASFLAALHDRGIYFRSIHFGNVIVLPGCGFGLIDLAEVQTSRSALSLRKRLRNIKQATCYPEDRQAIHHFGVQSFVDAYLQSTELPSKASKLLIKCLDGS